jgi:hypothetical protein
MNILLVTVGGGRSGLPWQEARKARRGGRKPNGFTDGRAVGRLERPAVATDCSRKSQWR